MSTHRFPADFLWGAGTAAYQIEGAWDGFEAERCYRGVRYRIQVTRVGVRPEDPQGRPEGIPESRGR